MIDAYTKANPNVKIEAQPGEVNSYWDKLATQTAGGQAPDIIQMDMNYIAEYGTRGALLDLKDVDVSKFVEGTVDSGKINDKLVGVNAGINSAVIFANPTVFEKAKMDLPDDTTWTWDQLSEVAAEVASKAGVPFGVASLMGLSPTGSPCSCARTARNSSLQTGLGLRPPKLKPGTTSWSRARKPRPLGTPEQISEESAKPLDQSAIVVGDAAMQYYNSNQLEAVSAAAGGELMEMLRFPSLTGKAIDRKTWYKGEHAVVGVSQDQEPGGRSCVDQLVCELPGGRQHREG